jgi:hypothetical protein
MAVPGQVIHQEIMVLTSLVHDLIEFCTASMALFEFVAFLFSRCWPRARLDAYDPSWLVGIAPRHR